MSSTDGKQASSRHIEHEISTLRDELGDLVGELDRRRREAFDVRLQLRRHPVAVALAGAALAVLVGGAVAALIHDARRKQRASYRARQLRVAFRRVLTHPERVARGEPPPSEKIVAAVGTALATLLVKRAFERAVPRPGQRAAAAARANGKEQPAAT